jgi:hypothetical protein
MKNNYRLIMRFCRFVDRYIDSLKMEKNRREIHFILFNSHLLFDSLQKY